ncbi:MAG: amidoligase family protein [Pseudomonadota bacterium]
MPEPYRLPPVITDTSGDPRRAGFEFEVGNLPIIDTARALQTALGGELQVKTPFEAVILDSSLGKLTIERDADLLKSTRYRSWLGSLGVSFNPGTIAHGIETNIDHASRGLIPCEVVTEPIALYKLDSLDTLVDTLGALGAQGTHESVIYAFGMHINPSIPSLSSEVLARYIKAFLLLYTWIIESSEIDLTRRFFTKYIDPFPHEYMLLALDNRYHPSTSKLIKDYLKHNPTRNRALDMLPILCELDLERVRSALNDEERKLVKGRPAFHYRLPDCKVNQVGWSAASAWNRWVHVEHLASKPTLLEELIEAWRSHNAAFSIAPSSSWSAHLTSLLSEKFLEGRLPR